MNLFGSTPILYLDRQQVLVAKVTGDGVEQQKMIEGAWDEAQLLEVCQQLKKQYGRSLLVLTGEDLSYVWYEEVVATKKEVPAAVAALVEAAVPEEFEDLRWEYRIVGQEGGANKLQILALTHHLRAMLESVSTQLQLDIKHIEPLSLALARQLRSNTEPQIILYEGLQRLAVVAEGGVVLASETIDAFSQTELKKLLKYVKEKYEREPAQLVQVGAVELPASLAAKPVGADPLVGIHQWQSQQQKNESTLALTLDRPKGARRGAQKTATSPFKWGTVLRKHRFAAVGLVIVVSLLGVLVWLLQTRSATEVPTAVPVAEPVSEAVVEESPEPSPAPVVELADYRVQVLNGSGQAGVASQVQEILAAEGFEEIAVGNADDYTYTTTLVQMKPSVPAEVFADIERSLNSEFVVELDEAVLTADSEYDVLVTIGSSQPE